MLLVSGYVIHSCFPWSLLPNNGTTVCQHTGQCRPIKRQKLHNGVHTEQQMLIVLTNGVIQRTFCKIRIWHDDCQMYSHFCAAADAEEFSRCRTSTRVDFLIICFGDQVIYIHSAEVGFSPAVKSNNTRQICSRPNPTCPRSAANHSAIMNCHGKRVCRVPQGVVNYPPPDKLCDDHQNGNFIKIKYDCVNPGKKTCWLMYSFRFEHRSFPAIFCYWILIFN